MAESSKWALWTQLRLLYVKGTWFGDTSWAAAKNGERRTRRGRDKPLPITCMLHLLLMTWIFLGTENPGVGGSWEPWKPQNLTQQNGEEPVSSARKVGG